MPTSYRKLDSQAILRTAERLAQRMAERFPDRGIRGVGLEAVEVAREACAYAERGSSPNIILRLCVALVIVGLIALELAFGSWLIGQKEASNWSDYMQGLDASVNSILLSGGAIVFLVSYERRIRRRRRLRSLQEVRALAHVVDMHQLTKVPDRLFSDLPCTRSSPDFEMTPELLTRYLDYCTELLSLLGNIAALYAQGDEDEVTLEATDAIANLCNGISSKVWQKMQMIQQLVG